MRISLCLLFFFFASLSYSQTDSVAIAVRNAAALKGYLSTPDSSIALADVSLEEAKAKKWEYAEAESYYILSKANWAKANYRLSVEYGYKALQLLEHSGHLRLRMETTLALERNFADMKNSAQAASMMQTALSIVRDHPDDALLAMVYREYSFLLLQRQQYDSAILFADKSLAWYEKQGDIQNSCILYNRKSRAYFLKKDYSASIAFNRKSIGNEKKSDNKRGLSIDLFQAAENYFRLNLIDSALISLRQSDSLALYIGNLPMQIRCHEMMAMLYELKKKDGSVLLELKKIIKLKDTLQQAESVRQIAETNSLNELHDLDQALRLLEHENVLERHRVRDQKLISWLLLVGIVLLVLVIASLWYLRRKQKHTNDELERKNSDISRQREEIRQQAEHLDRLNTLKSKLFSVISHDLRGPVANIQGLLAMLTRNIITPEEMAQISEKVKIDLKINQQTLENLLSWSLSQMDGIKTQPQELSIRQSIEGVTQLLGEMARQKGIVLDIHGVDDILVYADVNQIHLVLRNIVHNAIKFSLPDGVIVLSARLENAACRITIRDHGIGLDKKEIEILTGKHEYYTRVGTGKEKGTGLGWLLSTEFIQRNGGTYEIVSEPGQGAEFSFTLPLKN